MQPCLVVKELRSKLAGPFGLELAAGACAAVTGPSGSGKSLFLRMIADLDPSEGEVWLNGRERTSMPAPEWRRQATYVAAESGWWSDRTSDHFPSDRRGQVAELVARLGVRPSVLEAPVIELSTGEKQRLSLIRALLHDPRALLLDEPTGPLDGESTTRVETLLKERMAAGVAIMLVTHDPDLADRLANQRYRMQAGQLESS